MTIIQLHSRDRMEEEFGLNGINAIEVNEIEENDSSNKITAVSVITIQLLFQRLKLNNEYNKLKTFYI